MKRYNSSNYSMTEAPLGEYVKHTEALSEIEKARGEVGK